MCRNGHQGCVRAELDAMRYVYLGDRQTDPALVGQPCDPVRRTDGRCVVARGSALVVFADGLRRVVNRRRLRLTTGGVSQTHREGE